MHHVVAQSRVFKITPVHFFVKLEIRNLTFDIILSMTRPGVDKAKPKGWFKYSLYSVFTSKRTEEQGCCELLL